MNAKYRGLLSAIALICTFVAAPGARAETINAADYAVGTDVSDALPGVTLWYETYGNGTYASNGLYVNGTLTKSPLVIGTGYPINNQNNSANTLGPETEDLQQLLAPPEYQYPWEGLYAQFSQPINSISINGFVSSGIPLILFAYDTSGNLIGWSGPGLSGYYCLYYVDEITGETTCFQNGQHISFTSTTPIGSVIYGGYLDEGYATEIDIPAAALVPEPGTLGLLALGLMGLGLMLRHRSILLGRNQLRTQ